MPAVSILTIGMNHLEHLKKLLASVYSTEGLGVDFEMIYVDNCSTDGSAEYIEQNYPDVVVLRNEKPMGFAANNNKAARHASGEYLAIINPDVILNSGSLSLLLDFARKNDKWGVLAPRLLNEDLSLQYSVRIFVSLRIMLARILTFGNDKNNSAAVNEYLLKDIDTTKIQEVDWATGAALFMRHDFFDQLGGFSEDYFLYMEDEDLCLRSWKNQRPVVYVPQATAIHTARRESSHLSKMTVIHFFSLLKFFFKHGFNAKRPQLQPVAYNYETARANGSAAVEAKAES